MKTLLALSFGALMMAGGATAYAQTAPTSTVVSTPYTEYAAGSEQLPAFVYVAPAGEPADPPVMSAPQFAGGSELEPVFDEHAAVPTTQTLLADSAAPSNTQIPVQANGGR